MTVAEVHELKPGPKWDPSTDDVVVLVRGYLRDSINMYIYATKEQAQLQDYSGVFVSADDEDKLRPRCSEGYVELVARLGWMEKERQPVLIPIEAKKLTLRERGWPEEETCWKAE